MHLFPQYFRPQQWEGVRKKQFDASSDAFQQLLGDALVSHFSALAHVASTAGRDGAIDAWVDDSAQASGQFDTFAFPLIVECKHHDEALANTAYNIRQGWLMVKEKLAKQAKDGWPKLYAPWKHACAYLYCISARFPNQQSREDLQKEIRDFFASLPAGQRPSIKSDQIRVWDWSDIQAWLNKNTILCDHWLGIDLPQWLDHLSMRERLTQAARSSRHGFQSYLLEEHLPFVPPSSDDPAHPDVLLQCLLKEENLLLIGEGGIGKTRTMHEVSELAQKLGWRVLHLLPSDQEVDLATAAEVLLRPAADTLVLIDYIDQLAHFDARYWRSALLPEAQRRGIRLHLLTNARPSGSSELLHHLQVSGLFRSIELTRNPGHRDRINAAIEDCLCPTAIKQIGRECVKSYCGSRPIVAMFIAQALERLALAGKLANSLDDIPRPDDLLGWIRKRLREAQLFPAPATQRGSRWQAPPPPSPELVAIAAALAVCPFPMEELPAVVRSTLSTLNGPVEYTGWIVETLQKDGWIEASEDGFFRTPHDAIPDEVLRESLDSSNDVLTALLSSAHLGRPLGRFARSLGRLSGIAALPATQKLRIEETAKQWLMSNATALGHALEQVEPDVVAYALGAIFDYRPWHLAAQASWGELIVPWLSSHGDLPAARHLLHRGLKSLPDNTLREPALTWLRNNRSLRTASFILAPLLNWDQTRLGDQQREVLITAVCWLEHPSNSTALEAQFVLHPLLCWDVGRLSDQQQAALSAALRWLEHADNLTAFDAQFVLHPLLGWDERRLGTQEKLVLKNAILWLQDADNAITPDAGFVLDPLLSWDAPRLGLQQTVALDIAITWLAHPDNTTAPGAQFVLNPLLNWDEARFGAKQASVLTATMRWLEQPVNATSPDTRFVLKPLLRWDAVRLSNQHDPVLSTTLNWLHHPEILNATHAGYVLASLLDWSIERLGHQQATVLTIAFGWLGRPDNITSPEAQFVLHSLLNWDTERLGDQQKAALLIAVDEWFDAQEDLESPQVGFVLPGLIKWKPLATEKRFQYTLLALKWLEHCSEHDYPTHVLKSLLQVANQFVDELEIKPILMCAAHWLDSHPAHPERGFVIARLLRIRDLPQDLWEALAKAGLNFLEKNSPDASDDYLLNSIARRLFTVPYQHGRWTAVAVRWIPCANSTAAVSLFDYCRRNLPETYLETIRPALIAACSKRTDLRAYDWSVYA